MLTFINNRFINLIGQTKIKNEEINFSSKPKTNHKKQMARFNQINPLTKKVYKLQELYDLYSASQKKVEAFEATTSLKYSWNTICRQAQSLASERAKADTKKITRSIYRELSLELVNYPRK